MMSAPRFMRFLKEPAIAVFVFLVVIDIGHIWLFPSSGGWRWSDSTLVSHWQGALFYLVIAALSLWFSARRITRKPRD